MARSLCIALLLLTVCAGLSGCARDDAGELKSRLNAWFVLGDLEYFKSHRRCTVAIFGIRLTTPRRNLPVQRTIEDAKDAYRSGMIAAVRLEGYSPHDVADAMLLSGSGTFGKQALAAVAQAVPCFEGTKAEVMLLSALTRPGATLAYDRKSEGMMVLDPEARRVFYVAGDVW